jgi:hypothetical protein
LNNNFSQPAHNPQLSLIQKSINLHKHLVVVLRNNLQQQIKEKNKNLTIPKLATTFHQTPPTYPLNPLETLHILKKQNKIEKKSQQRSTQTCMFTPDFGFITDKSRFRPSYL